MIVWSILALGVVALAVHLLLLREPPAWPQALVIMRWIISCESLAVFADSRVGGDVLIIEDASITGRYQSHWVPSKAVQILIDNAWLMPEKQPRFSRTIYVPNPDCELPEELELIRVQAQLSRGP